MVTRRPVFWLIFLAGIVIGKQQLASKTAEWDGKTVPARSAGNNSNSGRADFPCPKKCLCFRKTVRCMFVRLDKIPKATPETLIFDLRFNQIRDIPAGAFSGLKHLSSLLLNNNQLTSLRNGAFAGLPALRYLYLYKNRISYIEDSVFHNLPRLEHLYLHNNVLERFSGKTFSEMPRLERLYLHSNLIHEISNHALCNLASLHRLFLHNNKIQHIPPGAFNGTKALQRLRLDSNALACDCGLRWLVRMLNETSVQAAAQCQFPVNMRGKSINGMTDEDFHCHKPEIMEGPHDVEVKWGATAIFTCKVSGDPLPEIIWMRDSTKISPDDQRISLLSDGSLKIANSQDQDVGQYECMAKSDMGEIKSRPARMIVSQPRNIAKPKFIITPVDQDVQVGEKEIRMDCRADGLPRPNITWTRNGVFLAPNPRYVITPDALVIRDVQDGDYGTYRCEALNNLGKISATAQLRINVAPTFTVHPDNLTVKSGSSATLDCFAIGSPTPVIKWYRDNRPVSTTSRITLDPDGSRLRIGSTKESDSGLYVCRATNLLGSVEASARLYVEEPLNQPPKLTFKPYDIDAVPGSTIEFPCRADGNPLPDIQWKKDGSALDRFQTRYRVSHVGSLYISNVQREDTARFECTASNEHGRASSSAVLTVKDEALLSPGDKFVKVAFAEASEEVDKAINNTVDMLFSQKDGTHNPAELFRIIRYPDAPSRELARAAEIYERTLINIRRHLQSGSTVNHTAKFDYKEVLSPSHLYLVAQLSGCVSHQPNSNCSDMCFHSKYRSITGQCNNLQYPTWGAANTGFRRLLDPIYENGFSQPVGWSRGIKYYGFEKPSARLVSTSIISTNVTTPDDNISHMVMQWGQFLDHDLDHATPSVSSESWEGIDCKKSCDYAAPCYPIEVPKNDPRIKNRRCIDFVRSSAVCGSGMTSVFFDRVQPREQINQLTSYIDASQVYGFSEDLARNLRDLTTQGGKLREGIAFPGRKPFLPYAENQGMDCRRDPEESDINCFVAGDIRINEQVGLISMHTIWMREHNRIATELRKLNAQWDGDTLYYETRKIVGAEMQHITYKHWLPIILGSEGMKMLGEYQEYDPNLNPSISNVFATAALRFGHSIINPLLQRLNASFQPIKEGHLPLHKAFFSPWRVVEEGGVDPILRGLFASPAKLKTSTQNLNSDLTEQLFTVAHAVSLDLAAINIQRSRDHALPGYLEWRRICNLSVGDSFEDFREDIRDAGVRKKLEILYGHPGNMDVWVGGILEDQVEGGKVGPLFRCLLVEQFKRLRAGDRFWYENPSVFKPEQLIQVKQTSLARILCDNTDTIGEVSRDVFMLPQKQGGYVGCDDIPKVDLRMWTACCGDCNTGGVFNTGFVNRRQRRAASPATKYSKDANLPGGGFSNSSLDYDSDFSENFVDEERLEGIESVIENFQKSIKQMRRQIRKLEQQCTEGKMMKHGHCADAKGNRRLNGEIWQVDDCTHCRCENHQINCMTIQCMQPLPCANATKIPGQCCAQCPGN